MYVRICLYIQLKWMPCEMQNDMGICKNIMHKKSVQIRRKKNVWCEIKWSVVSEITTANSKIWYGKPMIIMCAPCFLYPDNIIIILMMIIIVKIWIGLSDFSVLNELQLLLEGTVVTKTPSHLYMLFNCVYICERECVCVGVFTHRSRLWDFAVSSHIKLLL